MCSDHLAPWSDAQGESGFAWSFLGAARLEWLAVHVHVALAGWVLTDAEGGAIHARRVFEIEINSATDNPLIFADSKEVISGGNFHGESLGLALPCDEEVAHGAQSPLAQPITLGGRRIGNRFCIHPMEGWDGTPDGRPTEHTVRRWRQRQQRGDSLAPRHAPGR
mgnify:CR=1 FL=1